MADDPNPPAPPATGDDPNPDADLGDPGKKALDAERKARRDAEKQARDLASKVKELEDRDKSELQKLQDDLKERDSQLAELPRSIRQQAIRFASLAASAGFVDPEDALLNLGDIDLADTAAVQTALDELAERKPHLVRTEGRKAADKLPPRPKPGGREPLGTPGGDNDAKERAAAALRQLRQ